MLPRHLVLNIQRLQHHPGNRESALAGIYYSLSRMELKFQMKAKELAQEELKTLSQINEENSGKTDYDG